MAHPPFPRPRVEGKGEAAAQHRAYLRDLARRAEPVEPRRERLLQRWRDRLRAALLAALQSRRVTSSMNNGTPPVRSLTPSITSLDKAWREASSPPFAGLGAIQRRERDRAVMSSARPTAREIPAASSR